MPTDLAFGTGEGDYRQLRFGGAASLIPLQGFSAVASGTAAVANTAQAVFAVGLAFSEVGAPFAGAPAHLTFAGSPAAAAQLRFGSSASLVPLQGIPPFGAGKSSVTNAAWAVWMFGFDAACYGTPFRGPAADLVLQKPVPISTALTFGVPASLLPVPGIDAPACGAPAVANVSLGLFMAGFEAGSYGGPIAGTPTNLTLQDALPVGQPLDLYFNYGSALRPAGVYQGATGVFGIYNTARDIRPFGFDALAVGGWNEGSKTLLAPTVGDTARYGAHKVDTWLKYLTPQLGDAAGYGTHKLYGTTLTLTGFDAAQTGVAQVKLRTVFAAGFDSQQFTAALVYNSQQVAAPAGLNAFAVGATVVQYATRTLALTGFDPLAFAAGRPIVDNIGNREVYAKPIAPTNGYGTPYGGNFTRYLTPDGVLGLSLGSASISLLHRRVYPAGAAYPALGTPAAALFNRYLELAPAQAGASFSPAALDQTVRKAQFIGSDQATQGTPQTYLRNRTVQFIGEAYSGASTPVVELTQRRVQPVGDDMLRSDKPEAANLNRAMALLGTDMAELAPASAANRSAGVFLLGGNEARYGDQWVSRAQRPVALAGIDPFTAPAAWAEQGVRPGIWTGFDGCTYGKPELYNLLQIVAPQGTAQTGYGTPQAGDINRTYRAGGVSFDSAGTPAVKYLGLGPAGFDPLRVGGGWVGRAVRSVLQRPADDIGSMGVFSIVNLNRQVLAVGAPAPVWIGNMIVRDRTFRIDGVGYDAAEVGTPEGVGPRWLQANGTQVDGGVGRPNVGYDFSGQVHAYGVVSRMRGGTPLVYNNARILYPAGDDAAVVPKVLDVAGTLKTIHVAPPDENYYSDYTIVYNAAWGVYPAGRDMAGYGSGLDTANLNRTLAVPAAAPGEAGVPWVAPAVRTLRYDDRSAPQLVSEPQVGLWRRYLTPAGIAGYGDSLATVFEHFTIIKPVTILAPHTGTPALHNNTPELYMQPPAPAEGGVPHVYNYRQYATQVSEFAMATFGAFAITHSRRSIYPAGESMRVIGTPRVWEDLLAYPITRTVFVGEYDDRGQLLPGPTLRSNYLYPLGIAASDQFGNFTTREQSIRFDGSRSEYEGGAFDLDMLRVSMPRAVMKFTQYAYVQSDEGTSPVQIYMRRHHVSPDYVYPERPNPDSHADFWATPSCLADCSAFGATLVESTIRARTMSGWSFAAVGTPQAVAVRAPRINARGLETLYFGWLEVFGGQRWVNNFDSDGTAPLDWAGCGWAWVGRPPEPPSPYLHPVGLDALRITPAFVDTLNRQRVVGGGDMLATSRFVVTPPFFVTPVDNDLAKYGLAYADHRIRSIIHIGEDMFEAEPDYSGADETTVSTPAPPAPAQYIHAVGRKPPECCWGFYIGRGA